jgi:HAE1 family hydrophobic/amphiphilic exporter-1
MILSDTAIKRPVFTTMVIGAIIVFGAVAFVDIGIDLFPRVEVPVITIISVLPGADPETVEITVTDPIEESVSTISSIKFLRSTSADSVSQVVIEFELEKDVDVAYQEVQAKLGTVRGDLPEDLEEPVVEKFDIDAAPILAVIVSGDLSIRDLTRRADKLVKERLQRIPDVGQVKIVGGRDRQIWLWLDRAKLEGYGLAVQDVEAALRTEHVEYPGGRVESGAREWIVKTKAEFSSEAEFSEMVVAYKDGAPIRICDLGRVEDGLEEERSFAALGDRRAVSLLVRRQSGTNTVEVSRALKAEVDRLRDELAPQGLRLEIAQDLSVYIEHSVKDVQFHMLYGGGLAIAVVFFFLRNIRSTIISALVIPTAVIGTFVLMNALGFTQNMMTLLALSLAIGLLIDDSIVVQENTMRHVEMGKHPRDAASFATSEIALAVLATTVSVVAVFVPVAFMKGIMGRFFYQFGLTVAFAVMISLFVSFTLDPMLSSRFLRKPSKTRLFHISEQFFRAIERAYEAVLGASLRHRWAVILIAALSFLGAGYMARHLRSEFVPQEDQSEFNVKVKAPLGSSIHSTRAIFEKIRRAIEGQPWLAYSFTTIGADELQRVNEGVMYVKMTEKGARAVTQDDAMRWTREHVADIREAKVSVEVVPRISGGGMRFADLQLEIRGSNLDKLDAIVATIISRMKASQGYVDIDTTYEKGKPEVNVHLKRDRAADLGVSPLAVASTIKALIGGDDVSKFKAEGERYDVSVRLEESFRARPEAIKLLTVRSSSGELVNLENVARVVEGAGPVQIDRNNRARQITILANLQRDKKVLGEAMTECARFVKEAGLPPGYTFGFVGMAEVMEESFLNLFFALFLAVVVVYMALASQFESFIHPFTIMLSLPLSVVGALGALVSLGLTMSIFTMIGIIMLMGLVTKNAILLVDYTNVLRRRDGLSLTDAILKAGPTRLRPILMTTFAMVFGMLPIALGTGEGAESRAPMAVAVIGGLTTSTLLTLVVVPVVYSLLEVLRKARLKAPVSLLSLPLLLLPLVAAPGCLRSYVPEVTAKTESLESAFLEIVSRPELHTSSIGVHVVRHGTGEVILSHNAEKLLPPASCAKLVSCAGALAALGKDFRFETKVVAAGPIQDGVLKGDLVLVASGDPNLSQRVGPGDKLRFADKDHSYAGFYDSVLVEGNPLGVLEDLARQVADKGVREIQGDIVVDDGLFLETEDEFVGKFSAACVNDNLVDVVVRPGEKPGDPVGWELSPKAAFIQVRSTAVTGQAGSSTNVWLEPGEGPAKPGDRTASFVLKGTIPAGSRPILRVAAFREPALAAAGFLAEALAAAGVEVRGGPRREKAGPVQYGYLEVVARHVSPPFSEALRVILKVSQNLHATMLPVLVGALKGGGGDRARGWAVIREIFQREGLDVDGAVVRSGSGGARADHLTARWTVDLLRRMAAREDFPVFFDALPVGGTDGTLASAFKRRGFGKQVHAKTGTLVVRGFLSGGWIYLSKSLSGYLDLGSSGKPEDLVVFSILISGTLAESRKQGALDLFEAQEEILAAVLEACKAP